MVQRFWTCLVLVTSLLMAFTPSASADAFGTGTATIDWSSITITPVGNTTISYVSYFAAVPIWADYPNPGLYFEQHGTSLSPDLKLSETYDFSSTSRSVSLLSSVDMTGSNTLVGYSSSYSNHGGNFQDIVQTTAGMYLVLGGDRTINISGNYTMDASASAGSGETALGDPSVGIWVVEEKYGTTYLSKSWDLFTLTGSQSVTGQFNEIVTVPLDYEFRVQFWADSSSVANSAVPTPEPSSMLMLGFGLLGMLKLRTRSNK